MNSPRELGPAAAGASRRAVLVDPVGNPGDDPLHNPARTLAKLYRRCSPQGGCPYDAPTLTAVLRALLRGRTVCAGEISEVLGISASTVYGCLIELEDLGLARTMYRTQEVPLCAAGVSAEITAAGSALLRGISHGGRRP